jgi:hypothetical protein
MPLPGDPTDRVERDDNLTNVVIDKERVIRSLGRRRRGQRTPPALRQSPSVLTVGEKSKKEHATHRK